METTIINKADHKAAIIAFFNAQTSLTSTIREAFKASDFAGINDGLATLDYDNKDHQAKAAILRTTVRRVTGGDFSVRVHTAGDSKVWMVSPSAAKRERSKSFDAVYKAAQVLITDLQALKRGGTDGFDDFHGELADAVSELRAIADFELETEKRVVAIRRAA